MNTGGKKHLVGKRGKKLITYASKYSFKRSHTTVLSKNLKTFDKAIESDGPSMNKKSSKGKISRLRNKKKKKVPDVKERSLEKQKIKRLDSDSNSLSSEDDLPLSVLRIEHPVTAQHEDSDGSYKPNETDINSCWLVGCFGFNGPLRQYFSLYRAVSQREGERGEKG